MTNDHTPAAGHPAPGFRELLLLVCGAALAAGAGEVTMRLVARRVLDTPVFLDPASLWLAPLSAVPILALPVLAAWGIGRRARRTRRGWLAAVAVAALLTTLDVLMLVPRIHLLALVLLAAGVASQVTLAARRWPAFFLRVLRMGTAALFAVVVVGSITTAAARTLRERRALAALGDAPDGAPNVLLLVLDTVRALELSAYGYERATSPVIDSLAREGVRFDRAVATAPWTLPTHATLFTGEYQHALSVGWATALDAAPPTLAERLAAAGYATGGFVANMRYTSHEYGLARGFHVYRDYTLGWSQFFGSTMLGRRLVGAWNDATGAYVLAGRKDGRRVVDEFLEWRGSLGERPFFAFLNFFDAHEPYAPEAPYDLLFAPQEPPTRRIEVGVTYTPEAIRGLQDAYDGAIASLDAQLGRLVDDLRRRGALDNTIVIVTSDHGEEFGEHGHLSHGNGLHFPALHVPLVIRFPRVVPRDTRVATPVSLRDVPATILALTGVPAPPLPGGSLAPLWQTPGAAAAPSLVLSELYWVPNQPASYPVAAGNMQSLVRGDYHFIAAADGREELYDVTRDPFERVNLAADPALADTLAALRRALALFPMTDRRGR